MADNNIMNTGHELDWDDTISADSGYKLLPPGDYDFEVLSFERTRFAGSAKLPTCPKADLTIRVTDGAHTGVIRHGLFLHSTCEWRLSQFFTAIGVIQKGDKLKMDWNAVPGAKGRCKVIISHWTRGNGDPVESNRIDRFYDPSAFTRYKGSTPWDGEF